MSNYWSYDLTMPRGMMLWNLRMLVYNMARITIWMGVVRPLEILHAVVQDMECLIRRAEKMGMEEAEDDDGMNEAEIDDEDDVKQPMMDDATALIKHTIIW